VNRAWRWVVVIGLLAVVAVLVAGRPTSREDEEDFDPEGTHSSGTKALVLLLEELGAEVVVTDGVPEHSTDAAIVFQDDFDPDRAGGVLDWARSGGTLVVADPASPLAPIVTGAVEEDQLEADDCDVAGLDDVERVVAGGSRFEVPEGAASCFGDGRQALVVVEGAGDGEVVAVGGPGPFVNDHLDEADNAVLAARLLLPEGEGTTVAVLVQDPDPAPPVDDGEGRRPGEGDETLLDLVPSRVGLFLLQLVLAFLVYVWFRARRIGAPVAEPRPTPIAGSELVDAVGRLRREEKDAERTAAILRDDLRRTLCRRLGLPPHTPADHLVAVAEQAGLDPELLRAALTATAPDDDALVALARTIDRTRQEVLHEH